MSIDNDLCSSRFNSDCKNFLFPIYVELEYFMLDLWNIWSSNGIFECKYIISILSWSMVSHRLWSIDTDWQQTVSLKSLHTKFVLQIRLDDVIITYGMMTSKFHALILKFLIWKEAYNDNLSHCGYSNMLFVENIGGSRIG